MPHGRLTPAMRTCLRLLTEGDLYAVDFNVWMLKGETEHKPGRFVGAVVIRKMLSKGLLEFNEQEGVRIAEKGRALYEDMPEVRRGRVIASARSKGKPDRKRTRIGRNKGVTVYSFSHGGKEYTATTERDAVQQAKLVQARIWEKTPEAVPTIKIKTTRMSLLTAENAAKVLKEGIDSLVIETGFIDSVPITRKGIYRHYLIAAQESTEKPKGERRASKRSATKPTADPAAPDAP